MKLHHILKVCQRDWKSILINPMAIIIVLGLSILPGLYSWVNIYACWDVYENTGDIPVAVVNNDKGTNYKGKQINIGNDVIDSLKENHAIQWHFVSSEDADLGLIDSTYYAMIELPEDFSSSFLTILSDNPVKPKIIYKADTKINPVAIKITESAQNSLVQEIISTFVSTVNEEVFSSLNELGDYANNHRGDLLKVKDSMIFLGQNMDFVTNGLDTIGGTAESLGEFLDSINTTMPGLQSGLQTIDANNNERLAAIQESQPLFNQSAQQVNLNLSYAQTANQRMNQLCGQLSESIYSVNQAKVNSTIPALNVQVSSLENSIDATIDYLEKYKSYDVNSDIDSMISSLQNLKKTLTDIKTMLKTVQAQLNSTSQSIEQLSKALSTVVPQLIQQLDSLNSSLTAIVGQLEGINAVLNHPSITQLISSLKGLQSSCAALKTLLEQWDYSGAQLQETIASINTAITSTIQQIDSATSKIDMGIQFLKGQKTNNAEKKKQVSSIIASLKKTKPYIADEAAQLNIIQQELNNTNTISKALLDTMNEDSNQIATQLNDAIRNFNANVQGDINTISGNLITMTQNSHDMISFAQASTRQLQSMMESAKEGSALAFETSKHLNDRLGQFKDVTKELSGGMEQLDNKDIAQMIGLLQNKPEVMGDFFAKPFELKTVSINQIPNYGSGMAPLYTTLALWVGCLLLNAVLKTKVPYFMGVEEMTIREKHFGKMLTFMSIAMLQGLIIAIGNLVFLKVYTVNAPLFIIMTVFSSCVFVIITYTLAATMGNLGKAIAIIYLVFQIAGSGGSYPIQMMPAVFQFLKPLFPFTYTLNGLREAVAGPIFSSVALDFIALSMLAAAFLIGGFFLVKPLNAKIRLFERKFKESGLGE